MILENNINFLKNLVFIHIPKTGGTSLANALGFNSTSHIRAEEIIKYNIHFPIMEYFSFAVVRHPIDRFLSLYSYAKQEISYFHNNLEPKKALYGRHLDYELLKDATVEECARYLLDGKLRHDNTWNQWMPQYKWIYDEAGERILIDKFYKLENLEELKNDFERRFKLKLAIPHLNSSTGKGVQLTKCAKKIVEEYYQKDFALLNY